MEDTYEQMHKAEKEACRCTTILFAECAQHQHTLSAAPPLARRLPEVRPTSMYDLISKHPQIIAPTPKEPGYFAYHRRYDREQDGR